MADDKEPNSEACFRPDTQVFVDIDNDVLASSNPVSSIYDRAQQTRLRIESRVGGKPRVLLGFVADKTHPEAVRAYSAAGFTVRVCPALGTSGEASTDHQMVATIVDYAHSLSPRRAFIVTGDCGFAAACQVLAQLGVEAHVLTPSAVVPKALRATALTAEPLWPAEPLPPPASHAAAATQPVPQSPARPASSVESPAVPTRAAAGAPAGVYRDICCPLQGNGIAIPAIDGPRLREALRLTTMALERRDPVPALVIMAKSLSLGLRPAEAGFLVRAVREGQYIAHVAGGDDPPVEVAFASGLECIAKLNSIELGPVAATLHEWLAPAEPLPTSTQGLESVTEVAA